MTNQISCLLHPVCVPVARVMKLMNCIKKVRMHRRIMRMLVVVVVVVIAVVVRSDCIRMWRLLLRRVVIHRWRRALQSTRL